MKRTITYLLLFLTIQPILAQTTKRNFKQRELGILLGGSYYIGDLNNWKHFIYSKPAAGIFFRYTTNYRYAFRFGFNSGGLYGDDSKSKEPDQLLRNTNFRTQLYELNAIAEFNFVEYRIGHKKHYFSMFIFAGLAGFYINPEGNIGGGWEKLQPLRTEGQNRGYSNYQFSIPFGIGVKYNLTNKIGLGFEWGPRKTFTDYIDDVSGLYPDPSATTGGGLAYAYRLKDNYALAGTMRGNPRTKDWYFYYGLTINIKLRDPAEVCYGVGGKKYH